MTTDKHENHKKEKKTRWVVLLTAATMLVEIVFGLLTGSMALLADGIHMGSHVLAIGLSWVAYVVIRKVDQRKKYDLNSGKVLSLSGYTSGLLLLVFSIVIVVEAIDRLIHPVEIQFRDAILVAFIGLIVNIVSAFILHHDSKQSDVNIRAAYIHVLADALTSFSAIIGLVAAMVWNLVFVDAIAAIVSAIIIIKWSFGLLKKSSNDIIGLQKN